MKTGKSTTPIYYISLPGPYNHTLLTRGSRILTDMYFIQKVLKLAILSLDRGILWC